VLFSFQRLSQGPDVHSGLRIDEAYFSNIGEPSENFRIFPTQDDADLSITEKSIAGSTS
jgi:hypothetical protein